MKVQHKVLLSCFLVIIGILTSSMIAFADDANNKEVQVWWVNVYPFGEQPLEHCDDSAIGFNNRLVNKGWNTPWGDLGDNEVREVHFKRVGLGNGADSNYSDGVDIAFFSGHGLPGSGDPSVNGPRVPTQNDDRYVEYFECTWGDTDLEWMLFDCCSIFKDLNSRLHWFQAMNGLHLICASQTAVYDFDNGVHVSDLLIDDGWWDWARTIKSSWFSGMDYDNPSGVTLVVQGETSTCGDDYLWDQGSVCPDPPHDSGYTYWTYNCS